MVAVFCSCTDKDAEKTKEDNVIGDKLVINELIINNKTGLTSDEGKSHNWIEIANISSETQSLKGCTLVKDETERWEFPDTVLQPNECLIVWATKKAGSGQLNCGFKLKKHISLQLLDAEGAVLSGVKVKKLKADQALVLKDGKYSKTTEPTPGVR